MDTDTPVHEQDSTFDPTIVYYIVYLSFYRLCFHIEGFFICHFVKCFLIFKFYDFVQERRDGPEETRE